jgi:alpha-tubulin suppressor-like RCC1 family protein
MHASINFLGFARPRACARFGVIVAAVTFALSGATSHAVDGKSIHSWGSDASFVVSTRPAGTDFVAIAAGSIHSVALKTDGSVVAWGDDLLNQVSSKPNDTGFTAVSAGGYHSMALREDGSIVVWGIDDYGQVTNAPAATGFKAIAAGYGHNLALEEDGSIVAWGWDSFGQVSETPAGTGFKAIAAGQRHSLAIEEDGSLVAWGWDDYGLTDESVVPDGSDFIAVVAGVRYCLALRADGTLAMWGDEAEGLIANMPADIDFIAIAGGDHHCIALKADGSLVSWGRGPEFWSDNDGLLSDTPTGTGFVAIAAGSEHSVALGGEFPPVPTITSPENGAIISPGTNMQVVFTLAGDHADASRVELWKRSHYEEEYSLFLFYEDLVSGQWPPFEFSTGLLADTQGGGVDGSHSLRVRARNTGGQVSDSEAVSITVGTGQSMPEPKITSPSSGSTHNSSEPIEIEATLTGDISTLLRVEFYATSTVGGVRSLGAGTATSPGTYSLTWTHALPTDHVLTARAFYQSGAALLSTAVPVTVEGRAVPYIHTPGDNTVSPLNKEIEIFVSTVGDRTGLQQITVAVGSDLLLYPTTGDTSVPLLWTGRSPGTYPVTINAEFSDGHITTGPGIHIVVEDCLANVINAWIQQFFGAMPASHNLWVRMAAQIAELDLDLLHALRDDVLLTTPAGRYYADLYNRTSPAIITALAQDLTLIKPIYDLMLEWTPVIQAVVDGNGAAVSITPDMVANARAVLDGIRAVASPELLAILDAEEAALDPSTWAGLTGAELLARGESQVRPAPGISTNPASRAVSANGPVSFFVAAEGAGPFTYQWRRNGVDIAGATTATFELSNVQAAQAGSYSVVVSNPFGSTTSAAATLTVDTAPRLINISTRALAGAGDDTLVVGFFIDGTGPKTLLIRGIGPKLLDFGVQNVVEDPVLVVYKDQDPIEMNDDWDPALAESFSSMGAFELEPGSADAALLVTLPPGGYTVHLVNNGPPAEALIEVYDFSRDAGTRLVNLSCRMNVRVGETVIVGTGLINGSMPIVVRNAGPALGALGVAGTATDTHLRVYQGDTEVDSNDDWDPALEADFDAVGGFGFPPGSKDAALRIDIPPGGTTVHATVKDDDGVILVELYERK